MLKSMTAYGRSFFENSVGQCSVEVSCVNRRHLEVHLALPRELLRFEHLIRKKLNEKLSRGNLTVKASFRFNEKTPFSIKPNLPLCRQHFEGWTSIAETLGIKEEATLALLQKENLFILEEDEETMLLAEEMIMGALELSITSMQEMMEREGFALKEDIQNRLSILAKTLEEIAEASPKAIARYREKLTERLKELFPLAEENEERVLREVCLMAEKVDIAEEITRLKSHFVQFDETLNDPKAAQGKKLEFILQEMHREINTIASKSQEIAISRCSIEFKTELERIREQLQNVE